MCINTLHKGDSDDNNNNKSDNGINSNLFGYMSKVLYRLSCHSHLCTSHSIYTFFYSVFKFLLYILYRFSYRGFLLRRLTVVFVQHIVVQTLTLAQPVKKFRAFYVTRKLLTDFARENYWCFSSDQDEFTVLLISLSSKNYIKVKGKGKGHPITGHKGPRGGVELYIYYF
jgi:hypothetical protein